MTVEHAPDAAAEGLEKREWFEPWRFALLLGALIFSCFPQVVLGLETFAYGDFGQFAFPVAFYHREAFWRGEFPFWNPYNECGLPFMAQWNTLTLYPLSLFYLLLPLPWSLSAFCLGHIFLAGMGMYFLARRWTGYRFGAALAGVVFAFNGLTWYGVIWPHLLAALAWMPWVVISTERALQAGGRAIVVAGVVGAVQMLSGGAEAIVLTWCVSGLLWLWQIRPGQCAEPGVAATGVTRVRVTLRFGTVILLVAGLAAVQLGPFLDLLLHSQRFGSYAGSALPGLEAMPLSGWANLLVPLFHCVRNPEGVFLQPDQSWTGSYYVGVSTIVLALLAVWRVKSGRVRLLALAALFGLIMALGSHGLAYSGFRQIFPAIGFMRFPVKFVMLAVFAAPLMAAYGLAWLGALSPGGSGRAMAGLRALAVGISVAMLGIVVVAVAFPVARGEALTVSVNAAARAVFLVLILGCVWLASRPRPASGGGENKLNRLLQTAVIVLVWFDVFTHAPNLSPTAPSRALEPNAIRRYFGWNQEFAAGDSRAMLTREALFNSIIGGSESPELDVNLRRMTLMLNFNLLDRVPKFDGFYSSELSAYLDLFKQVYFTTNPATGLEDFLGISCVNNPTNVLEWARRSSALPLVTAGQAPIFADEQHTLNGVLADGFSSQKVVYLPLEAQETIRVRTSAGAKVRLREFAAQKLSVDVEAEADAMVVIAQSFYHPWQVYVDGAKARLWRANYAFQALQVGKGRHEILLRYEDRMFYFGAAVSGFTAAICLAAWFLSRRSLAKAIPGTRDLP